MTDQIPQDPVGLAAWAEVEAAEARVKAEDLRRDAEDSHPYGAQILRMLAAGEELIAAQLDVIAADPEAALKQAGGDQ